MLTTHNYSFLKDKKVLLLSDTGNPYKYLIDFIPELTNSKIYIYVSPASTSKFIKLFVKQSLNKKVKIIKDKNFSMFYNNKIKDYYVCIFFGKNNTQETAALKRLTRDMLLLYNNIIVITENGVDYDEDYTV